MNAQLQQFARDTLKKGLAECSPDQQLLFKRMYVARKQNGTAAEEIAMAEKASINEVVDKMPEGRLDWAMQQVSNTIAKNEVRDKQNG